MQKTKILFFLLAAALIAAYPLTGYAGTLLTINGAVGYIPDSPTDEPTDRQKIQIIVAAQALQTAGGIYNADDFNVIRLANGTTLFALLPYQSNFYTDLATISAAATPEDLSDALQIMAHPVHGYRQGLGAYTLQTDLYIASGQCLNNNMFGAGGGRQYILPVLIKQGALYAANPITQPWNAHPRQVPQENECELQPAA